MADEVVPVAKMVDVMRASPAFQRLGKTGLPLSELRKPEVVRQVIDAALFEVVIDPEDVHKTKDRIEAAKAIARMNGFDSPDAKKNRVLEDIAIIKRKLAGLGADAKPIEVVEAEKA